MYNIYSLIKNTKLLFLKKQMKQMFYMLESDFDFFWRIVKSVPVKEQLIVLALQWYNDILRICLNWQGRNKAHSTLNW